MADDAPGVVSPYARARQLHAQAIPVEQIQQTLVAEGVDPDSAKIVVAALTGVTTREAQGQTETAEPPPAPTAPPTHPCPAHAAFPVIGSCTRCGKFYCGKCVQEAKLEEQGAPSTRCPECRVKYPEVMEFGGWLLLPLLHQLLVPATLAYALYTDVVGLMGRLKPGYFAPVLVETITGAARLVFCLVVMWHFFKKKRRAIPLTIAFYVVAIGYALLEMGINQWVESFGGKGSEGWSPTMVIRILLGDVLWLAYFLQSKRVRATFVRD